MAGPAGAPAVLCAGPPRAGRPRRQARRCRPGHIAAVARPRPRRHRRRGASERYDEIRAARPEDRLSRPGRSRGPMGRPPLHVLLRDERLAVDIRGRQRPRGRPRTVLRRPRGLDDGRCSRPGSARPLTTRRATTSGGAGTTHGWRSSRATRSSIRAPAPMRHTWSAASTSCCCRSRVIATSAGRSISCGGSGATPSPSPTRATWPARVRRALSVPFVDYARGDGVVCRTGRQHGVDADPRRRRGRLDRSISGPVGPRHRRPVRGRACARRAEVHADGFCPAVMARPTRVRGPGQDGAAVPGDPGPGGPDRRADGDQG